MTESQVEGFTMWLLPSSPLGVMCWLCDECGAMVPDTNKHKAWHEGLEKTLNDIGQSASYAEMWLRPLG